MELNYKVFGEGQPLIILHGLFGMLDNWQTLARRFAKDHQVFLVDQRNHGKSPHDSLIDYPSMAEDLNDFIFQHNLSSVNVLGHSMGGKTAMQFALHYPERLHKLIVVDIAPKPYRGGHELIFEALLNLDVEQVQSREDADNALKEKIEEPGIRLFLLKNLSRKKEGGYQWKMNLPAIHHHYQDILKNVEVEEPSHHPSLFIKGGLSRYIKAEDESTIQSVFPNATISSVPNAGHWVHAEAPQPLYELVTQFLAS